MMKEDRDRNKHKKCQIIMRQTDTNILSYGDFCQKQKRNNRKTNKQTKQKKRTKHKHKCTKSVHIKVQGFQI